MTASRIYEGPDGEVHPYAVSGCIGKYLSPAALNLYKFVETPSVGSVTEPLGKEWQDGVALLDGPLRNIESTRTPRQTARGGRLPSRIRNNRADRRHTGRDAPRRLRHRVCRLRSRPGRGRRTHDVGDGGRRRARRRRRRPHPCESIRDPSHRAPGRHPQHRRAVELVAPSVDASAARRSRSASSAARQRIDAASRMVNHLISLVVWIVITIVGFHRLDIDAAFFLSSAGFIGAAVAMVASTRSTTTSPA